MRRMGSASLNSSSLVMTLSDDPSLHLPSGQTTCAGVELALAASEVGSGLGGVQALVCEQQEKEGVSRRGTGGRRKQGLAVDPHAARVVGRLGRSGSGGGRRSSDGRGGLDGAVRNERGRVRLGFLV